MKRFGLVVLIIVVWTAAAAVLIGLAARDAVDGKDAISQARASVTIDSIRSGDIDGYLKTSRDKFGAAHNKLDNPVVWPFRWLPWIGRQVRSATALTGASETVSSVCLDSLTQGRTLVSSSQSDHQALLSAFATLTNNASNRLNGLDLGPKDHLVHQLRDARNTASSDLTKLQAPLRRSAAASSAISNLFNVNGNYLVIAANSAEMRAGSGSFLSVGDLHTGGGSVHLDSMTTVQDLMPPKNSIVWPKELSDRWGWLGNESDWRNLMTSPRFDVAAPIAAEMWQRAGKAPVSGVIVIDPVTLQHLLAATGPVEVAGQSFDSSSVLDELMLDQYKNIDGTDPAQLARREVLSGVAGAVFSKLNSGNWDPIVLARQLGLAADARHVLAWSSDPSNNAKWQDAGVGGTLDKNDLMLSMLNFGINKLDQFQQLDAAVTTKHSSGADEYEIDVTIKNAAPSNLPRYVDGGFPGTGLVRGEYKGVLAFNLPGDVSDARLEGLGTPVVNGPDGLSYVLGSVIDLRRGETKHATIRFTRKVQAGHISLVPGARVPATTWHYAGNSWIEQRARVLSN